MKIKTSELTGPALDWAVAKAEWDELAALNIQYPKQAKHYPKWSPSTDWSQGGPIIEREEISVEYGRAEFKTTWIAYKLGLPHEDNPEGGPTPLIAAMRCFVASKLGDEVEIPDELTT